MRNVVVGALFVVAFTACWGPYKGSSSGGTTGTGGSSGSTCNTCGDALAGDATGLCAGSSNLWAAVQECACGSGPCSATCFNSLCTAGTADSDCNTCMQSMCASTFANCAHDMSQ